MKKLLSLLAFCLLFVSCEKKNPEKIYDANIVCEAWKTFCDAPDTQNLEHFIDTVARFEIEPGASNPEFVHLTCLQIEICLSTAQSILPLLTDAAKHQAEIYKAVHTIDDCMFVYLKTKNFMLEEMHQKFFTYFMWLFATIFAGAVILIVLNIRESKHKDKIISNSEQLLQYSIQGQEAERKRISQELHDSVAQGLRYVSLLAENLSDKKAAQAIIGQQNENIEAIRTLCYNLTPPAISADNMIASINLLGQKIFEPLKAEAFQYRVVAEPAIDFSQWKSDELMNIYRIVQEALQNIQKHARASEATVFFKKTPHSEKRHLKIIITDDGCGISEQLRTEINTGLFEGTESMHFGLRNIFERAKFLGGTVAFRSEEDCGTQIVVEI